MFRGSVSGAPRLPLSARGIALKRLKTAHYCAFLLTMSQHQQANAILIDRRSFQAEPIVCKTHGLHIDVVTRVANHIASRLSRDSTPLIHMHISCMYPIHIVYMYTSSIKHMHIYFYYVYNIYHTPSIHRRVTKFKTSNRKHDMHNNITGQI